MPTAEKVSVTIEAEETEAIRQRLKTSLEDPRPDLDEAAVRVRLDRLHADTLAAHVAARQSQDRRGK